MFCAGMVAGLVAGAGLMITFPGHPERRTLTAPLDLESSYYFRGPGAKAPVMGQLQPGSELEIQGRKGGAVYVRFATVMDE